jgi:hypothetical protein
MLMWKCRKPQRLAGEAWVIPLAELPQALPPCLGRRVDHENEDPAITGCAMRWSLALDASKRFRPLPFTQPRWGGSFDALELLANGPLCSTQDESLRNALRWMAVECS